MRIQSPVFFRRPSCPPPVVATRRVALELNKIDDLSVLTGGDQPVLLIGYRTNRGRKGVVKRVREVIEVR